MLRLQRGLDGTTPINVVPRYLVVPAHLEVTARQFTEQINATTSTDVNRLCPGSFALSKRRTSVSVATRLVVGAWSSAGVRRSGSGACPI